MTKKRSLPKSQIFPKSTRKNYAQKTIKESSHRQIKKFRQTIQKTQEELTRLFFDGVFVNELMEQRTNVVDDVLKKIWELQPFDDKQSICLIAVAGYGRKELHLYSDIDLLILLSKKANKNNEKCIENFISFAWDIGLEIGHSVRTFDECIDLAKEDIGIFTNLLETRLLIGSDDLFKQLTKIVESKKPWSNNAFFNAKREEQINRHQQYGNTANNIEPNIKNSPGGLRDIHTLMWLTKRFAKTNSIDDLYKKQLLTKQELTLFKRNRDFLWKVRYALHAFSKKCEDRLLLDTQKDLAAFFGYQNKKPYLMAQGFMKQYYNAATEIVELNNLIWQLLKEKISRKKQKDIASINKYFQINQHDIEIKDQQIFQKQPHTLLEIFLIVAQHQEIKGINSNTIRAFRKYRKIINRSYRSNEKNNKIFIALLQCQEPIGTSLQLMNRYKILSAYIPEFENVIGQMQYDLFHIYTVDQHTLLLIKILSQFSTKAIEKKFPLCTELMNTISKPELLYIAALFHDIAKGEKGSHSERGAKYVKRFCARLSYENQDSKLITWLVRQHLLMSQTAIQKDIHDPEVIRKFALKVKDKIHLKLLYLLTVADINATNPSLWNNWKASLFKELFFATQTLLDQKNKTISKIKIIQDKKQYALELLTKQKFTKKSVRSLWKNFTNEYFLRESTSNIAWHTQAILSHDKKRIPLVLIKPHYSQGANEIFIYMPDQDNLFATSNLALNRCNLNILEAHIITSKHDYSLDSYIVLDMNGRMIEDETQLEEIKNTLMTYHKKSDDKKKKTVYRRYRMNQTSRYFSIETAINFEFDKKQKRTHMKLITTDRPGLLACVGQVFIKQNIRVQDAKISTLGKRVEDYFSITNKTHQPLTSEEQEKLREEICQQINNYY